MIPEVICLTANKYLSRSTLIGRGRPDFLVGEQRITGFLQYALQSERWSHFLTQPAKVDSPMQRMIHHEDAETVFG